MDGKNIDSLKVRMYDLAIQQEYIKQQAQIEIESIQKEMEKIKTTIETLEQYGASKRDDNTEL